MTVRSLFAVLIAGLVLVAGSTLAGEAIVIESTDPTHEPGALIADGATLSVAAGAAVTLLAEDGSTVRVEGPYDGPPPAAEADDQLIDGLANLFGEGAIDANAFGAVRAAAPQQGPGDLWAVDVSLSGHRCIDAAGPRGLWRGAASSGKLRALAGGAEVPLGFADAAAIVPWPAELPVGAGGDYAFLPDGGSLAHVVLHRLDAVMPTAGHLLRWLGEQGCTTQARLLLARMIEPPEPLTLELGTDRGTAPVLRVGEPLALRLATNRDAWVHCLYELVDGTVVGLFPNRFTGGPRLGGHVTQGVPSGADKLNLTMSGPTGQEQVRCFGWTEDPAARLPAAVAGADITQAVGEPLDALLAAIEAAEPEAVAAMTIEIRE